MPLTAMTQPSTLCWMATISGNGNMHLGVVNISIEEEGVDLLLKTPTPRKDELEIKSAKEVEAGIHHVAAYKSWSLNEELVNATPSPMLHLQLPITLLKLTTSPKKRMVVTYLTIHHINCPLKVS